MIVAKKVTFILIIFLLASCAPVIRRELEQVSSTLPEPPVGSVLLHQDRRGSGGSECEALSESKVYGASISLREIVNHYQVELENDGWTMLPDYGADPTVLAAFQRNDNQYLAIYTQEAGIIQHILANVSKEKLAAYESVYILDITVTCGK